MRHLFFKSVLKAFIVAFTVWVVLLCLLSVVSLKLDDANKFLSVFSVITLAMGAIVGGKSANYDGENKIINSLICAFVITFPLFPMNIIFSDFTPFTLLKLLLVFALTFISTFIKPKSNLSKNAKARRKIKNRYLNYKN